MAVNAVGSSNSLFGTSYGISVKPMEDQFMKILLAGSGTRILWNLLKKETFCPDGAVFHCSAGRKLKYQPGSGHEHAVRPQL